MTLEEVSKELSLSPNTIKGHFKRTQDTLLKKGILLTKEGRGKETVYQVEHIYKKDWEVKIWQRQIQRQIAI